MMGMRRGGAAPRPNEKTPAYTAKVSKYTVKGVRRGEGVAHADVAGRFARKNRPVTASLRWAVKYAG
jgi:hypothetical protein